jgi:spermidine/putrescine-binding protein
MKKNRLAVIALMLVAVILSACSSNTQPAPTVAPTEAAAASEKPYAGTVLTVYNWYDYIAPDAIALFEKETGMRIEYVNFTTNEEMYTKLEATPSAYDVLFPSDYIIERLIREDMLAELNYDNMPNAAGLIDWLKGPSYDEGGKHSVAYMWGTVGILYNRALTGRDIDSWMDLFSDEFKGSVLMMNSVRDTLGVALKAQGFSMNTRERAELEAARDLLIEQKTSGVSAGYLVDETKDKMVAGEAALALMWSGDALYAMEKNEDLAYAVPKEGSNIWVDGMCVPKASKNIAAAEVFIDFMCREDIARMNMDEIYYSTPVQAVVDNMDPEEAENEVLNPPADVVERCEFFRDISEDMELYEEIWMEVRLAR